MSGHNYVANPNGGLFDEDDVDDETFLKNSRVSPSTNPFEEQKQSFEEKRREIEDRTIKSSQRSLGLLRETEEVGVATAVELSKQREQLEKTSRQLDEISSTLRFSQKHLNGLKSVFGGLKNYLSGNRDVPSRMTASPSGEKLSDEEKNQQSPTPISPDDRYNTHPINRLRNENGLGSANGGQLQNQASGGSKPAFNQQLDENLDEMCGSLSRLKGLAIDLKSEIDTQNDLLDNMNYKIEDVDIKMGKQNKEMNKILGKK